MNRTASKLHAGYLYDSGQKTKEWERDRKKNKWKGRETERRTKKNRT